MNMNKRSKLFLKLLVILLLLTACNENNNSENGGVGNSANSTALDSESEETTASEEDADSVPAVEEGVTDNAGFNEWLQQLNNGQIAPVQMDETLDWGLGYFLYYGSLDAINALGIDNMIYHALEARRRLDTGEVTEETISQNDQNLLTMTEGLLYNSEQPLTDQVSQNEEVRQAILDRIVDNQQNLSPEEALESNNLIGVFGGPAAGAIGGKYLVFVQTAPGEEYKFLGVIMAVDAAGQGARETFSFNDWNDLAWLGDAAGPFWDDLPTGTSGEPANTGEARPGVLLVSEEVYKDIAQGDAE